MLCGGSISSADMRMCNKRFWALKSKSVAHKAWEEARMLGVNDDERDDVYGKQIALGERRDGRQRIRGRTPMGYHEYYSLNIRGLRDNSKIIRLSQTIKSGSFDLVCLQETKREALVEYMVENLWGNQLIE